MKPVCKKKKIVHALCNNSATHLSCVCAHKSWRTAMKWTFTCAYHLHSNHPHFAVSAVCFVRILSVCLHTQILSLFICTTVGANSSSIKFLLEEWCYSSKPTMTASVPYYVFVFSCLSLYEERRMPYCHVLHALHMDSYAFIHRRKDITPPANSAANG